MTSVGTVLIITRWHPTIERPGWAPFLLEWTAATARIADPVVVHLDETASLSFEHSVSEHGHHHYRVGVSGRGKHAPLQHGRDIARARQAIKLVGQRHSANLLHAHAYPAALPAATWRGRPPMVITEHFTRLVRGDMGIPQRGQAKLAYRAACELTAVGATLAAAVEELSGRPPVVIPNPISPLLEPAPPPRPPPPLRLVAAGRLETIKGFDVLLEALSLLHGRGYRVHLTLLGDGSQRHRLTQLARDLRIADHVHLPGSADRDQVWSHMCDSHLVVVPSRFETFSLVAAEALALGRPVVVTRCGGPEEFVNERSGRIVDPQDPAQLARAIHQVGQVLPSFAPHKLAATVTARFSIDTVARELESVYHSALVDQPS